MGQDAPQGGGRAGLIRRDCRNANRPPSGGLFRWCAVRMNRGRNRLEDAAGVVAIRAGRRDVRTRRNGASRLPKRSRGYGSVRRGSRIDRRASRSASTGSRCGASDYGSAATASKGVGSASGSVPRDSKSTSTASGSTSTAYGSAGSGSRWRTDDASPGFAGRRPDGGARLAESMGWRAGRSRERA